jgi:serine protease
MAPWLRASFPLYFLIATQAIAQQAGVFPGEALVMLREGARVDDLIRSVHNVDGALVDFRAEVVSRPMRTWLLRFEENEVPREPLLRVLRGHPLVALAQWNHVITERQVPDDPQYIAQWHHATIDSEVAWDITTGGVTAAGDTIVLAIIERADLMHQDLAANAWINNDEVPGNGIDDDGNGYVDDVRGWNTPLGNDEVYASNHGTQVAGMAGAVGNNGEGVAGANWDVELMPVGYGTTQESAVIAAYTYPLVMRRLYNNSGGTLGAFVVATNASWGIDGGQPDDAPIWCSMYDSLGYVGVLSCGSTANNNVNVDVVGDLPTACPSPYLISVTSTNDQDLRTSSGYGLTTIDVAAPGQGVRTTGLNGNYLTVSGTSFASPLTAGVIALLYSAPCDALMSMVQSDPAVAALYVRDILFDGVELVGNLPGTIATGGRINSGNSMQALMQGCGNCLAPYDLQAVNQVPGSTGISWNSIADGPFNLRYRVVGAPDWIDIPDNDVLFISLNSLAICTDYECQVQVDCGNGEWSPWSQSLLWTTSGCCSPPAQVLMGFIGDNIANVFWIGEAEASTYDVRVREVGTVDWTVIIGDADTFTEIPDLVPCTNYEVQVASVCASGTNWSESVLFITLGCTPCIVNAYCPVQGLDASEEWIARVVANDLDHPSASDDGYALNTLGAGWIALNWGWDQYITLTPGFSSTAYDEWWTVQIDGDGDGLFEPNELVYQSAAGSNGETVGLLNLGGLEVVDPFDPIPTRMRVTMQRGASVLDPCVSPLQGEVEDYCVYLAYFFGVQDHLGPPPISVAPNPADDLLGLSSHSVISAGLVRITDATGRIVLVAPWNGTRCEVPVLGLAVGTYAFTVSDERQLWGAGRFVVVR